MIVKIEEYERDGAHKECTFSVEPDDLPQLIESLAGRWNVNLSMSQGGQELVLSISDRMCAVMAILGGDEFYDFVERGDEAGWLEFVHGGQPAEHPRRHCISMECATRISSEFARGALVDANDPRWERQGTRQNV